MDRKAWIAIILSVIGLVAVEYYNIKTATARAEQARLAAALATPTPTPSTATSAHPSPAAPAQPAPTPSGPVLTAQKASLYTKYAEYIFSNDLGGIESAILYGHRAEGDQIVTLNGTAALPIGAIGEKPGVALGGFEMTTDTAKGEAIFTRVDADGLQTTKRIILPDTSAATGVYALQLQMEFKNNGKAEIKRAPYFVSTGGAAPIHSNDQPRFTTFDWMHERKFQTITVDWFNPSVIPLIGIEWHAAQSLYSDAKPDSAWAGVASQYFCSIVSENLAEGAKGAGTGVWSQRYNTKRMNEAAVFGIQGGLWMPEFSVAPGQTVTKSFTIYSGPKDLKQLRALTSGQDAVMNFGMFAFISEFLLWAMNGLNALFHPIAPVWGYGWAIIVLTLCIKTILWPLQNKATTQMKRMALLSPKMTELRDKYKDDPQKMNEETMKLYRDYGVNPFSGCLPMLIQIPIFFGFYSMLGSAIQLRNSSFLWVHDLSQPDTLTHVLGFPINVLPLVMAASMIWQMAISPKSGDAVQQRMFYFMPVIFLVFCYNYASGLALYWTTQNIFSIVQLYVTRNQPMPTLEKKSVIQKREADVAKKLKKKRPGL